MCYTLKNISSYLGSPIPTDNGNQTMHEYDALGNRVRTTYYTRKSLTAVPIGNILHPENNTSDYTITVDGFNENIVYTKVNPAVCNGTTWMPKFVHNPEGMMRHYSYEEHYPFYFIKDHLGNIRETYINPAPNTKYLIQRMQYYPSGIPWKTSTGAIEHPYRYNGKELVQMHGQDEYDSKARWYYPAICRTTTMDPLCEKYYNISPYAWCGNNPIMYVDPDGRKWKTKRDILIAQKIAKRAHSNIDKQLNRLSKLQVQKFKYSSDKKLARINKKIADAQTQLQRRGKLEKNIKLLTKAGNTYTFNTIKTNQELATLERADDGTIIINNYGYEGNQAHEVTHAAQYENGKLIYVGNKTLFTPTISGGFLALEVEAYQTEYSISGNVPESEKGDVESVTDIDAEWVTGIPSYDRDGNKTYPYMTYGTHFNTMQGVLPLK